MTTNTKFETRPVQGTAAPEPDADAVVRAVEAIHLSSPTVMRLSELAAWAQIGKNSVPRLVKRFNLRELTGQAKGQRFSVHDVMRKMLGVTPRTPHEMDLLLQPLQKAGWVSQMTGMSVSAINAAICENRLALPAPVELTETSPGQAAARSRRWLPAQIEAHLRREPVPFASAVSLQTPASQPSSPLPRNVFAAICGDNAEVSR